MTRSATYSHRSLLASVGCLALLCALAAPAGAQCAGTDIFADDMESGQGGWTTYRDVAGALTNCTVDEWHLDNTSANSGAFSWSNTPYMEAGGIDPAAVCFNYLQAPVMSVPVGTTTLDLVFWHKYNIEDGFDFGNVEVSTDGTSWTQVAQYTGISDPAGLTYNEVVLNLNGTFTAGADYHLRFEFTSDQALGGIGWSFDDLRVVACIDPVPAQETTWGRLKSVYRSE